MADEAEEEGDEVCEPAAPSVASRSTATPVVARQCDICVQVKPSSAFSKTQLRRPKPKCAECIENADARPPIRFLPEGGAPSSTSATPLVLTPGPGRQSDEVTATSATPLVLTPGPDGQEDGVTQEDDVTVFNQARLAHAAAAVAEERRAFHP